jgi:ankyrin repeat protein
MKWLISEGVDVLAFNSVGTTARELAAKAGRHAEAEAWLAIQERPVGCAIPAKRKKCTSQKDYILNPAVTSDVKVGTPPFNSSAGVKTEMNEALTAAIAADDVPAMIQAVVKGASTAAALDQFGYATTPLHIAAEGGHMKAMTWLIEQGADVGACANYEKTVLQHAAKEGHVAALEWLLDQGADVQAADNSGNTALHSATLNGHVAAMEVLIERGADVTVKNEYGATALHNLAKDGHLAAMMLLVKHGAKVGAVSKYGATALHVAAGNGHVLTMKWLISEGVDVLAFNSAGKTARELAAKAGHAEAEAWLAIQEM